jgi:toxin YoeB
MTRRHEIQKRGTDAGDGKRPLIVDIIFLSDLQHWIQNDRAVAMRLTRLMLEISRDPFTGTGKPEPLKHNLHGHWSRRLTHEHRMIYAVTEKSIQFLTARFHY